jgi:hypothetical protein
MVSMLLVVAANTAHLCLADRAVRSDVNPSYALRLGSPVWPHRAVRSMVTMSGRLLSSSSASPASLWTASSCSGWLIRPGRGMLSGDEPAQPGSSGLTESSGGRFGGWQIARVGSRAGAVPSPIGGSSAWGRHRAPVAGHLGMIATSPGLVIRPGLAEPGRCEIFTAVSVWRASGNSLGMPFAVWQQKGRSRRPVVVARRAASKGSVCNLHGGAARNRLLRLARPILEKPAVAGPERAW